jgi:hypothetical protein
VFLEKNFTLGLISYSTVQFLGGSAHLDFEGRYRYRDELHILEPEIGAKFWDHEFLSPTFTKTLQYYITEYIKNYGGKK